MGWHGTTPNDSRMRPVLGAKEAKIALGGEIPDVVVVRVEAVATTGDAGRGDPAASRSTTNQGIRMNGPPGRAAVMADVQTVQAGCDEVIRIMGGDAYSAWPKVPAPNIARPGNVRDVEAAHVGVRVEHARPSITPVAGTEDHRVAAVRAEVAIVRIGRAKLLCVHPEIDDIRVRGGNRQRTPINTIVSCATVLRRKAAVMLRVEAGDARGAPTDSAVGRPVDA